MKAVLVALIGLAVINVSMATHPSGNLIVNLIANGDFSDSPCDKELCIYDTPNTVKGWIPNPMIEVGFGFHYNQYLNRERVLDLAANSNSCVKQVIKNIKPDDYQLIFEYAARTDRRSDDCQFEVSFNGNLLKKITPADDRFRTEVIGIHVNTECDGVVEFCSVGGQNNVYGAILKTVQMIKKLGTGVVPVTSLPLPLYVLLGNNLIINPNFAENSCNQPRFCTYNFGQPNILKGWVPDPEVELGIGNLYNKYLGKQRIIELATDKNTCVKQIVRYLTPGFYTLAYRYAARSNRHPSDCKFQVSFNNVHLKRINPFDDIVRIDIVGIEVQSGTQGELKFCGVGQNNFFGAVITQVQMVKINPKLASQFRPIQPFPSPTSNLIFNGGFQLNSCDGTTHEWCTYHERAYFNQVQGWQGSPEIEVVKSSFVNAQAWSKVGQSWVIDLDATGNSCIKQRINTLSKGRYTLRFDWAAVRKYALSTSAFDVKLSGRVLGYFHADDLDLNKEILTFDLDSQVLNPEVEFCGKGTSDNVGASIDNVELLRNGH